MSKVLLSERMILTTRLLFMVGASTILHPYGKVVARSQAIFSPLVALTRYIPWQGLSILGERIQNYGIRTIILFERF